MRELYCAQLIEGSVPTIFWEAKQQMLLVVHNQIKMGSVCA